MDASRGVTSEIITPTVERLKVENVGMPFIGTNRNDALSFTRTPVTKMRFHICTHSVLVDAVVISSPALLNAQKFHLSSDIRIVELG